MRRGFTAPLHQAFWCRGSSNPQCVSERISRVSVDSLARVSCWQLIVNVRLAHGTRGLRRFKALPGETCEVTRRFPGRIRSERPIRQPLTAVCRLTLLQKLPEVPAESVFQIQFGNDDSNLFVGNFGRQTGVRHCGDAQNFSHRKHSSRSHDGRLNIRAPGVQIV